MAVARSRLKGISSTDLLARARSPSPDTVALLAIVGAVVIANFLYWSGLFDQNPLGRSSGLGFFAGLFDPNSVGTWGGPDPGLLAGLPMIDPSNGQSSQALGHLAALDWIHLRVPWWNPYEGTGMPLAGGIASGALFPPTLLLLIGNGQVYEYLLLELVAGISTYFLLRRISVGRSASTAAAIAFALNGTFAWYGYVPANPVAFLPLLLLGIEIAFAATTAGRLGGWWLIAIALALSIYAGFPETAYVDGLFAAVWFGWRCGCAGRHRLRAFATKAAVGGIVGALLATPVLVAFADYAAHAELGLHAGNSFANAHLPAADLPQLVLPYVYGPIWGFGPAYPIWGQLGGYLSASLLFFGLLGLIYPGRRGLRPLLFAWIVLVVAKCMASRRYSAMCSASYRECPTWPSRATPPPRLRCPWLSWRRLGWTVYWRTDRASTRARRHGARAVGRQLPRRSERCRWCTSSLIRPISFYSRGSVIWAAWSSPAGVLAAILPSPRARRLLAVAIVCLDALAMFVLPQLSAPRSITVDTAPATVPAAEPRSLALFTLGPLGPNYGSYYAIR